MLFTKDKLSLAVGLAGFLFVVFCFYPGLLSPDSVVQLHQAIHRSYDSWHPPIMSAVWTLWTLVIPGAGGMLIFHNLMFWLGLTLWVRMAVFGVFARVILILGIGFLPCVMALLSTIWKDVGVGVSLVFATALLALSQQNFKRWTFWTGILALWYAYSVRHNSPPAIVPLLVWASWILFRRSWIGAQRYVMIGILSMAFLFSFELSKRIVDRLLIQGKFGYPFQVVQIHDLIAVSLAQGRVLLPAYVRNDRKPPWSLEELQQVYSPVSAVPIFWGDSSKRRVVITNNPSRLRTLWRAWWQALQADPEAYFRHRWAMFKNQMGFMQPYVDYPFQSAMEPNQLGAELRPSRVRSSMLAWLGFFQHSPLFRGWIFLAFDLVLALWGIYRRDIRLWAVASSGFIFGATYFFISPAGDFRYIWWTVLSGILGLLVAFSSAKKLSGRTSSPETLA